MRAAEHWQTGEQHLMYMWAINKPSDACLFSRVHRGKISTPLLNISQGKKCSLGSAVEVGFFFFFFLSEFAFLAYLPLNLAGKGWVLIIFVCLVQWKKCYLLLVHFTILYLLRIISFNDGNSAFRVGTAHCNQVWKRQECAPESCPLLLSNWKCVFILV